MTARPNARGTFDEFLMECRMLDLNLTQRRLLISWCWCLYKRDINSYRRTYLIFLQNSELSTGFWPNRLVCWNNVELHSRGAWFQPLLEHGLILSSSRRLLGQCVDKVTTASFHILSNSFTHHVIRRSML